MLISSSVQCDSPLCGVLSTQLQLEIALLQGELQAERNQLHRHTQQLHALLEEATHGEKHRHIDRHKVRHSGFPKQVWEINLIISSS